MEQLDNKSMIITQLLTELTYKMYQTKLIKAKLFVKNMVVREQGMDKLKRAHQAM
ncbi:hypothetical protein [Bacillus sp. 7884-1]|uniref:hypothetical protein n=1 Tax=Bacillus sp. 7884-1 TaxID=2021693 RepID=UPI0015CAA9C8|nr:hypothetical protein [Bacillus sp. 7884-1]